jgi:hypothetical protein
VSAPCIRRMIVTFNRDEVEISITYSHDSSEATATPGSKKRTTTAARMARKGLEHALEGLDAAGEAVVWGGFATDTSLTTDVVVLDRKKRAAA